MMWTRTMTTYVMGIDAGTSGLKALVVDQDGTVHGRATATYSLSTPRAGWVEADPREWWQALRAATHGALAGSNLPAERIAAIGFSGQMHTLVLLDRRGDLVRPAISWADTRSLQQRRLMEETVGRERLIAMSGNPALTAFTATKLLWVRQHEPERWARAQTMLLAKDYLRWRLIGGLATDPSDAGASGLLDVHRRIWSDEIVQALDLPASLLPPIIRSDTIAGTVSTQAASETGLRAGTPVACGAGDQECAALGCGVTDPGPLLITIGTGGQVFAATAEPVIDRAGRVHTLPHAPANRWHVMAAIPAAGLALDWLRTTLGGTLDGGQPPAHSPPVFLPALAGERTPTMNEAASGVFFGLDLTHRASDLVAAVREGVAMSLRSCVDVLDEMGMSTAPILLTGGLSNDPQLVGVLSSALARPLYAAQQREGSAFGAALLAFAALGHASLPAQSRAPDVLATPDPDRMGRLEKRYAAYRQLSAVMARSQETGHM
jgi:xylulokinase